MTSGPPEFPGIQRGIGLNHLIDQPPGSRSERSPERADHAGGDGVMEAVRIANRDHELSGAQRPRVAERDGGTRSGAVISRTAMSVSGS